jgi:hypothetical protein
MDAVLWQEGALLGSISIFRLLAVRRARRLSVQMHFALSCLADELFHLDTCVQLKKHVFQAVSWTRK